ncbi:stalk domain-containing protein [Paenibacillus tyrfis]|uniref:stalk domain-containing protein n=1 Tax=Paenibacillus tyrfis TaxID=1501230 RepID=UPI000B58DC9B|nr:stalk domain-containing protein [Paenibacillus tyrfis]
MKKLIVGLTVGMMLGSAATAFAAEDIGKEIKAVFAKFNFKINGVDTPLETTPLVYEGTAYLPVREVGKLTGYTVSYKEDTQTIELTNVTSTTYTPPAKSEQPATETVKKADADVKKDTGKAEEFVKKPNEAANKADGAAWVDLRDLMDALDKKYKGTRGGATGDEATLVINEKEYKLKLIINGMNFSVEITPLIEANVITLEEVKKGNK